VDAIALRLKRIRQAKGLSQAAWCRLVGIPTPQWHNYESGLRRIALDPALKVCAATGVSLDWIYRGITAGLPYDIAIAMQRTSKTQTV
jgi:transcriptional regulator with XRE-family HTH domain